MFSHRSGRSAASRFFLPSASAIAQEKELQQLPPPSRKLGIITKEVFDFEIFKKQFLRKMNSNDNQNC